MQNQPKNDKIDIPDSLTSLRDALADQGFCQTHCSFLVNLAHVKRMNRSSVVLTNDKEIPVSRRYQAHLVGQNIEYLGTVH